MSTVQNLTWYRGQTEEWTLTIFNADGVTPSNLTTARGVEFEVKPYAGAPDPAKLHLDQVAGISIRAQLNADIGICDLVATATQTFSLSAGIWHFDVFVIRSDGARKLVMSGVLTVAEVVNFP